MVEWGFQLINWFILPFWALMLFAPKWSVTERVIRQWWYLAVPALYYVVHIVYVMVQPSQGGPGMAALLSPTLQNISALLGDPKATPAAWSHYLAFDLFVGRWIYLREENKGYHLAPILLFTLMLGPSGLLIYLLWRRPKAEEEAPAH